MKLFLERLKCSFKKESANWFIAIVMALVIMFGVIIIMLTTVLFPIHMLGYIIGDYSYLWVVALPLGVLAYYERKQIKRWFNWQFIEPFKKDENRK